MRLIHKKLIGFVFVALILLSFMAGGGAQFASAAASSYSDVLDDLRQDESFDLAEYPEKADDYGLYVKHIAESEQGELLIYVYQPTGQKVDLKASSINIAKSENATASFENYPLTLQSKNGVFYKYKVEGFELSSSTVRYYNISNILRPYDKVIDESPASGTTITEVPNAVGQLWTVYPGVDTVTYEPSTIITVTEKYVGYVNYSEGMNLGWVLTNNAISAHFVAFSTDKPVDQLISADVSFKERSVTYQACGNLTHNNAINGHKYNDKYNYKYGEAKKHEPDPVTVTYKDKVTDIGKNSYTWDRIRTTAEFLEDENNSDYKLTSESSTGMASTQWVLNFYETSINAGQKVAGSYEMECQYTEVSDVIILRLKYEYDGEKYNLGVVDNKMTGSKLPGNTPTDSGCAASWEWLNLLPAWAWFIIFPAGIAVIVVLSVLFVRLITASSERRTQAAATSVKRTKNKHNKGATRKRKRKTPKKKGGKK